MRRLALAGLVIGVLLAAVGAITRDSATQIATPPLQGWTAYAGQSPNAASQYVLVTSDTSNETPKRRDADVEWLLAAAVGLASLWALRRTSQHAHPQ